MLLTLYVCVSGSKHNNKTKFGGGKLLVSLRCYRDFTSASSCAYSYRSVTKWYQFHIIDAWWFSLRVESSVKTHIWIVRLSKPYSTRGQLTQLVYISTRHRFNSRKPFDVHLSVDSLSREMRMDMFENRLKFWAHSFRIHSECFTSQQCETDIFTPCFCPLFWGSSCLIPGMNGAQNIRNNTVCCAMSSIGTKYLYPIYFLILPVAIWIALFLTPIFCPVTLIFDWRMYF